MSANDEKLKINPRLRFLVLPLTTSERAALEKELLTVGSQKQVQCWYNCIISEFERVELCKKYNIPFQIVQVNFRSEVEIVAQICERELRERILPPDMRRYLIGTLYNAEKIIAAHRVAGTDRYKEKHHREPSKAKCQADVRLSHIRERLGTHYHLNPATITRYATYAEGIDNIFHDDSQMAAQILCGEVKMPVDVVRSHAIHDSFISCVEKEAPAKNTQDHQELLPAGHSVKDMPKFDPDAEINSLALTVPSWVQSLNRTRSTARISLTTDEGRRRLCEALHQLINTADKMRSELGGM